MKRDLSRPPTPDLFEAVATEFRRGSALGVLFSHAVADKLGVNSSDLECLDLLQLSGPVTAGKLAEHTGLSTGAITGLVDRLEKAGYVRRAKDPTDRRRAIIEPVPAAIRKIQPMFESMATAMMKLSAGYSARELAFMHEFAKRANAIMLEEIGKLREK